MIRVKFFSSFCNSENCVSVYTRILEHLNLPYYNRDLVATTGEDYTHVVILGVPQPQIQHIPKENVLGLAFEPPHFLGLTMEFIQYAQKNIGRYYIGDTMGLPAPFMSHHGFMWYCPFPRSIQPKDKIMSIIFSRKQQVFGHQYRHTLVRNILSRNWPIDIWGLGCDTLPQDTRVKGKFRNEEPYDGYRFTIAIENFSLPDYFSEKLTNSLLYECTPLYYGATNINGYFPGQTISLTGQLEKDLAIIDHVLHHPELQQPIDHYEVLRKVNIWDHLLTLWSNEKKT